MKVTYLGHACFLVDINGSTIIFDPFIRPNDLASNIEIDSIEVDYIFVTHGHEDHVADVEYLSKKCNAKIVSNFEICTWFEKKGCTNYHPMNIGGNWNFEFGKVKYVNAVHSSTMPDGSPGGNSGGFLLETDEANFYYAGDTSLHYDMQLIPMWCKLDVVFLPIGDNFTMGIEDAVLAAKMVKTQKVIGMHYDTFGFIEIDHENAKNQFSNNGLALTLMHIGENIGFGKEEQKSK